MAMQSSPVSNVQFSMSTSRHDSGLQPSLFGPWLSTVTPRMVTFSQSTGLSTHIGELVNVTPSMSTLLAAVGLHEVGPQIVAGAEHAARRPARCPRPFVAAIASRTLVRAAAALPFQGHQCRWPGLAVERALAGDRDVLLLEGVDQRRVVHHLVAFESREHRRKIIARLGAEADCGALCQMQIDVAPQMDRPVHQPIAGGNDHAPAARFVTGRDGLRRSPAGNRFGRRS